MGTKIVFLSDNPVSNFDFTASWNKNPKNKRSAQISIPSPLYERPLFVCLFAGFERPLAIGLKQVRQNKGTPQSETRLRYPTNLKDPPLDVDRSKCNLKLVCP